MRIGNFAIRKMRNYYNRRTRFAWLLMMVYLPMLLAITFHYHTAEEGNSAAAYCSDCDHHVHHDGHLATSQGFTQECPICHLQALEKAVREGVLMTAEDEVQSTRAPPALLTL